MAKINDHIRAVLDFSPRDKEALLAALVGIDHRNVHEAASALGKRCKELRIADFPNPFRGIDDDIEKMWAHFFGLSYSGEGVAMVHAKRQSDQEMLDGMTKAAIVSYMEERYGVTLKQKTNRPKLIERALTVIWGA